MEYNKVRKCDECNVPLILSSKDANVYQVCIKDMQAYTCPICNSLKRFSNIMVASAFSPLFINALQNMPKGETTFEDIIAKINWNT